MTEIRKYICDVCDKECEPYTHIRREESECVKVSFMAFVSRNLKGKEKGPLHACEDCVVNEMRSIVSKQDHKKSWELDDCEDDDGEA